MNLSKLLSRLIYIANELPEIDILNITENSKDADQHSLFICICGYRSDGHHYATDAYNRGCRVFVAEKYLMLPSDATVIYVPNTHIALAKLACSFYGDPSHRMKLIGITGTKGKTTTACLITQILRESGMQCGYIGTNGISYGSVQCTTVNTTPDAITLQKTLSEMEQSGCRTVVLEISSQALMLHRADGIRFDTCLFTNLSQDHIGPGEHPDFASYIAAKERLFYDFEARTVIANIDDPHTEEMLQKTTAVRIVGCSAEKNADYMATAILPSCCKNRLGMTFTIQTEKEKAHVFLPMVGSGNVYNSLLAVACAVECFGISLPNAAKISESARISGRSEILPLFGNSFAVIDYAHNGVSLRQLLTHLRTFHPNRLICLFGSVGERSELRRLELGKAAAELADLSILTSDNPGGEAAEAIIADIAKAYKSASSYLCIPDRREAIRTAVDMMRDGDILVLAGKGHEAYQLVGNRKLPFSEKEILLEALEYAQK